MNEKPLDQTNIPEEGEPEILVNEYGETRDSAVVVDEPGRTVLLTDDETIVIDKEPRIDVVPVNRPRKVYGGMWGPAELVTIAFAMVALMVVVFIYIFMVAPANRELARNRADRDRIEAELISTRAKYGGIKDTEAHVSDLMTSVDNFESRNLSVAANGRTSLYQHINSLIAGHGLVNTSGPDYVPLETADQNTGVQSEQESGRAKFKSLFPGVYVTMTVEGPYQNLRRFIRDIETGGDFIVVSAVELEPSDTDQQAKADGGKQNVQRQAGPVVSTDPYANPNPANPNTSPAQQGTADRFKGKTHGEVVSLRLEMAAYFRRPNAMPQTPATTEQ